jgi:nucleoside-diphosphate-sugar epimerase
MSISLITGATGFVGSHLAQRCRERGLRVRAVVRPSSDLRLLRPLAVEIFQADLADRARMARAVEGVDTVVHCAAKVGEWGPVEEFRAVNVDGLRGLLEACRDRPLRRFVHLSSLGVYAARHHHGTDESEPLPDRHIDGYTQTKVEAERLVLEYHRQHRLPAVVLRPGFIYGPRDRTTVPALIDRLKRKQVRYLGSSAGVLNTIYVGNLVDAIFLALEKPQAVGQVYNLTDGEKVTRRRFLEALAQGAGVPGPRPVPVPLPMARLMAWWLEGAARRRGDAHPPLLTQARVKFLGLNLDFSIAKARRELGYDPQTTFEQGMSETVAWLKQSA